MAYSTGSLDGTTVAAGGVVPFGALKNAPSGTRVNTKMLGDIWQMMMQMAAGAGITLNNLPDNNTNGYQFTEALSKVIGNHAGQIVRMLIGGTYDPTKVYILWGCEARGNDGFCLYDSQIYFIEGNSGPVCGGGLVDVISVYTPTLYTDGVQSLRNICAAPGSGIANFTDVIYLQIARTSIPSDDITWIDNPGDAPRCSLNPLGQVQLSGGFEVASGPAGQTFAELPSVFRPYKDMTVQAVKSASSVFTCVPITISTAGKLRFANSSDIPAVGGRIFLDGIQIIKN